MAAKSRFRKLVVGPSERITAKQSTVGCVVIADYLDLANAQRTLVLERQSAEVKAKAAKKQKVAPLSPPSQQAANG